MLYKLYVARRLTRIDEPLDKDPALDFLNQLVPAFRNCLTTPLPETPADHLVARVQP